MILKSNTINKNIFLVTDKLFNNNKIFDLKMIKRNDYRGYEYFILKQELSKLNISLSTYDDLNKNIHKSYDLIFMNLRKKTYNIILDNPNVDKYLIITEPEPLLPISWDLDLHSRYFTKIFTWNDDFVDNQKYFKFYYPNAKINSAKLHFDLNQKRKLCVVVAGNKHNNHKLALYAERVKAIRWFERNHPEDFDLFGIGWDKRYISTRFIRRFNKYNLITKNNFFKKKFSSYKGSIESKIDVLRLYKFSICYENLKNLSGYITEKIFDCFLAGTIPVYLGARNIKDYVPEKTFIDKENFKTYEELYRYLNGMSVSEYSNYLIGIKDFIESKKSYPFTAEYFAKIIIKNIT